MEYNNYYPAQPGHPPPSVTNQHGGQQQIQQQPPPGGQIMHAPMPSQNIRQAMPPGPPSHHQQQQLQQQQHLGHHSQQMPPQHQHPNYHQIQPPHPHGPPVSHSGSPHPQQQQHHNHQATLSGPSTQQGALSSQQHHLHPQSPHHHGGPPMHIQQQQQQLNQMVRPPPLGPSVMNHPQSGLQQPPHQHQSFFTGGPIPQSNLHHYPPQQNQHHPHHQPQHHHHHQHHHQPPHQIMHHAPQLAHHPHIQQQGVGRNSPYYPSILQTEYRIIELNRRLQCRPIPRQPVSPLPHNNPYDESLWWERFVSEFFEDDATLTMRTQFEDKLVDYTIGRTLIPRFFRSYFDGGVTDLSINLRNPKEACVPPLITLDCDQAFIITNHIFRHPGLAQNQGVVVHTEGHFFLEFVSNNFDTLSIKSWKFYTKGCREYIDRSITNLGLPLEPITRQGFTKSTIWFLKMCMIVEPMQDLMSQYKQTKMEPRTCLRKLLFDKYKFRSGEDNRAATNKRRKRKPSAAPAMTGPAANKKKNNVNNNTIGNNSGLNNVMMSPSGPPFSLASQDVMVVGEPSMMGGDFGDDNERMITRLENTQYDPTASTPSNAEESDSMNTSTGNDNGLSNNGNNNNIESNIENHTLSPSLLLQHQHQFQHQQQQHQQQRHQQQQHQQQRHQQQQHQQQQHQQQVPQQVQIIPSQVEQSSPQTVERQHQQRLQLNIQDSVNDDQALGQVNQGNLIEHSDMQHLDNIGQMLHEQPVVGDQAHRDPDQITDENLIREDTTITTTSIATKQHDMPEDTTINSIVETTNDSNMMLGVNSVEQIENHTNSIQPLNEESNSNSQLPCSTASAATAMEQQQPVDNGVA